MPCTTVSSRRRRRSTVLAGLLATGLTVGLTACSGGGSGAAGDTPGTSAAGSTSTAGDTGSAPTEASTGDATATSPSTSTDGATSTAGATTTEASLARCTADHLEGMLGEGEGGGAAGSVEVRVVLTNTGDEPCSLQGWPGVSFVGGGNGTQIGAAATQDRTAKHPTVMLLPNGHAHVPLQITQAENYPKATCRPTTIDGLRIYVPGETKAIFVRESEVMACANKDVEQLRTQAVVPGSD